jgi:hypothetical protein
MQSCGFEVISRSHLGCFLYLPFRFVKKRNQKLLAAPEAEQKEVVTRSMRQASNNPLMHAIMRLEAVARKVLYLPVGIRCLVTCRRP